jgi:hypothetical protein
MVSVTYERKKYETQIEVFEVDGQNFAFAAPAVMSDGHGGWQPVPALMTEAEAIRYLRLNELSLKSPANTIRYYRQRGLLKATPISKVLFYSRKELDLFIERITKLNEGTRE